jgi:hypothetical protein
MKIRAKKITREKGAMSGWFLGEDYSLEISKRTARKITNFPLPKIGFETAIASTQRECFRTTLYLQNVCGDYVLSCCNSKFSEWANLFDINVQITKEKAE